MENGKSPGIDSIPIEFYKEFIETIKTDLQKFFNEILFSNKKTPKSWNQAIITLIPKKVILTTKNIGDLFHYSA